MTEERTDAPARPIWQTTPCPSWCGGSHHDADSVDARECASHYRTVPLTTEDTLITSIAGTGVEAILELVEVRLEQRHREVAPRITLYRGNGDGFGMTLEETDQLIEHLTHLRSTAQAEIEGARS